MNLVIKLTANHVCLSKNNSISYPQTNLYPAEFQFRENLNIYCRAEIVLWDKIETLLTIRILEYDIAGLEVFEGQQPKSSINKLHFTAISWPDWSSCMVSYRKASFAHLNLLDTSHDTGALKQNVIHLKFKVSLKHVFFRSGYALVKKRFKWSNDSVEIKIPNENLLPEFEFIKPFIQNFLGRKTIDVKSTIELRGEEVINATGSSIQIDRINKELLDIFKFKTWKNHIKETLINRIDKNYFTNDELFADFDKSEKGNISPENFEELFKLFLKNEKIRNEAQLVFLAGKIHEHDSKIFITLHPDFGFIFYAKGEAFTHFIWELLNSHATYIWSFDKDVTYHQQLDKLSIILAHIKQQGRSIYKQSLRSFDDPVLHVVRHASANSLTKDHFPIWKLKLAQLLV